MFGMMMDWRFARHFDFYAGVSYSQKTDGFANGFMLSNNNGAIVNAPSRTTGSPTTTRVLVCATSSDLNRLI